MAIEKPSETSTHDGATVGYWLSETDERKAIFEQGREQGIREGLGVLIAMSHDKYISNDALIYINSAYDKLESLLPTSTTEAQETPTP